MPKIDLEGKRERLDREITFFHLKKAKHIIIQCIDIAKRRNGAFFIYYFIAQECILKEDFSKAIIFLNKALNIRGDDGLTLNDKAICLAELGRYSQALACFDEGLAVNRNCATLYHNKGWLLNSLGRFKESAVFFEKALELDPNRPESLYSLADTYFHLNDKKRSKKYFHKAILHTKGKSSFIHKNALRILRKIEKEDVL